MQENQSSYMRQPHRQCQAKTVQPETQIYLSPFINERSPAACERCRESGGVDVQVLFRCRTDPDVAVILILVNRFLAIVYTLASPVAVELPDGRRTPVRLAVAIGRLFSGPDRTLVPRLERSQYPKHDLLPLLTKEILEWWGCLSPEERVTILKRVDDQAATAAEKKG